jgi:CheY-like chemotaxis protein
MQAEFFTEKTLRILVVDDIEINCELLEHLLRDIASLDIAYSGETALVKVCQNTYDVILLDISLGMGMDGFEVLQEIKSQGRNKNTPVIAVTGSVTESYLGEFLIKGFKGFLSKPFTKQELMDAINKTIA